MKLPLGQSLTLVVPLTDAEACRAALRARAARLEQGWAKLPDLHTACLALVPSESSDGASHEGLLLECCFDGSLSDFAAVLFQSVGDELSGVLGHCEGYPVAADTRTFTAYLSERARRAVAFRSAPDPAPAERGWLRRLRAVLDLARLACAIRSKPHTDARSVDQIEAQRVAVAMQEPEPGVPLLHVARLLPEPRARQRLKRALRDVELESACLERGARVLLHGEQLLFLAYPDQSAPRWSERTSELALPTLTRIWANTVGFLQPRCARRALRARQLSRFLLDYRLPVAAWFNARSAPPAA